jgi:rSAM/selenodomain-associated transferase 2
MIVAERQGAQVIAAPRGRARQQNVGAALARGDVFLFLHADNWLGEDCRSQVERALESGCSAAAFRQRIEADGYIYRLLERGNAARARWLKLPYGDQGIVVRRDLFERLGGFPDVQLMEDVLLMRKLRQLTTPILLPGPLHVSARRWEAHGVVRQTLRNWAILAAWRLGIRIDRLAQFYHNHHRPQS